MCLWFDVSGCMLVNLHGFVLKFLTIHMSVEGEFE